MTLHGQLQHDWIPLKPLQVPYEEYPLIHTRQNPSWDDFKKRGNAVLRYSDEYQRVRPVKLEMACSNSKLAFL